MLLLLTALMALGMLVSVTVDLIIIRWHYQDRKRMVADERQIAFEQTEIEDLRNERHQTPS